MRSGNAFDPHTNTLSSRLTPLNCPEKPHLTPLARLCIVYRGPPITRPRDNTMTVGETALERHDPFIFASQVREV
jgi:hypothetical protein